MYEDKGNGGRPPFRVEQGGGSDNPVDELVRIFRQYFGGGGGSGGGRGKGASPTDNPKFIFFLVGGLLVLLGLYTSFYTVDVSEEAVVVRFGKYLDTTDSGLHFKMPFLIDRVYKVPSKVVLQEEFGFRAAGQVGGRTTYNKKAYAAESLMLTGDLNVADVEWIVQYRISDPWKFLFRGRNVKRTLRDVSMSIMRRVVGDRIADDVLTGRKDEIVDQAKVLTQEVLDKYDLGLRVESVILQDVNPPESVKPAFNEVEEAKQEQEKAINTAEQQYNKVIPEARGKAERQIAEAEAYAIDVVNRAKGDANRFLAVLREYRKAPAVTRERIFIDSMQDVFANLEKVTIIDSKVKGVLPLYNSLGGSTPTGSQVKSE